MTIEPGAPTAAAAAHASRSASQAELRARDRRVLWHPFTQMRGWSDEDFPVIRAGQGAELIDADGRRYLDGTASLWCALHGHRVPRIDAAVAAQLGRVAHSTLLGLGGEPSIEVAESLLSMAPGDAARVFFSDSGSSAVEIALKMAFQYWRQDAGPGPQQRTRFLCLQNAYHGDTIGAVSVGGIDLFHETFRPLLFDAVVAPVPTGPSRAARTADVERCLQAFDGILAEHGHEFAALILEPGVQGAAGMRVYPDGFTRAVVERARAAGLLVIVDEVATGFGRSGEMFACDREGIEPDLLCLGKGLSGGYLPLAATVATERIYAGFLGDYEDYRTFFHGHTFTGNALGCAAAVASLELCRDTGFLERARAIADGLGRGLTRLDDHPHVLEVRRYGSMVGIEVVQSTRGDDVTPYSTARRMGHQVSLAARRRGVLIRPLGDTIVLMPPLCMTADELTRLVDVTCDAIDDATRGAPSP